MYIYVLHPRIELKDDMPILSVVFKTKQYYPHLQATPIIQYYILKNWEWPTTLIAIFCTLTAYQDKTDRWWANTVRCHASPRLSLSCEKRKARHTDMCRLRSISSFTFTTQAL